MLLFLPDHPSTARFFTPRERDIATRRLEHESNTKASTYQREQVLEALIDPQVWLISLFNLTIYIANGGISAVSHISVWLCVVDVH